MTNFLKMSAFHAFEKTYFISITAGILCPIFQIWVLPALQILCQSSALKNLCQPWCIIPPTSSLPLLMWQNKPRPIRIKALKRSLKPLKVPLNWGMTIWAVWQQMLNGVIASPPQQSLLSHNIQAYKHSHMRVCLWVHTHTNNSQHPSFTQSTAVVSCNTCIVLRNADLGPAFSFIFVVIFFAVFCCHLSGLSLAQSLCCIWTVAQDENKQKWKFLVFFSIMICFCLGHSHVMHHWRHDAEMWRTGVNTDTCGLLETDMKEWSCNPLVCADVVRMSACEWEFCVLKI